MQRIRSATTPILSNFYLEVLRHRFLAFSPMIPVYVLLRIICPCSQTAIATTSATAYFSVTAFAALGVFDRRNDLGLVAGETEKLKPKLRLHRTGTQYIFSFFSYVFPILFDVHPGDGS